MLKSCLTLLAIFGVALFFELRYIRTIQLPYATAIAFGLALLVTLALGSLQGLAEARARTNQPETSRDLWQDGELVRVSGFLRTSGSPVRAPFSGRQVVFYQYWAKAVEPDRSAVPHKATWRGMDQSPWELQTTSGRIRLKGVPALRQFLPVNYDSDAIRDRAAQHLAAADWRIAPGIWSASLTEAESMFANENNELPVHLMNPRAVEVLAMTPGQRSPDHYRQRLSAFHWIYQERAIEENTEVTVSGTYRAAEGAIDISLSLDGASHEMAPGSAAQTAQQNLTTTVIFLVVLFALAGAAHFVVYSNGGALLRRLLN